MSALSSEHDVPARHATPVARRPAPADAAATLYTIYQQQIHTYCAGQLRDRQEADDAVQSTFLYAFALLQRGVEPETALPWLYTIAHNVCRTRRRALKRRHRVESAVDIETLHDSVGRDDPSRDEIDGLAGFLAALPPGQRNALLLREWQGLSYSEIAARLEISESAVETLLFRARRNLAGKLQHAASRVTAAINGALVIQALRRLATSATGAKSTAATVALGIAAASTLTPLLDSPARTSDGTTRRPAIPTTVREVRAVHHAGLTASPADVAAPRGVAKAVQPPGGPSTAIESLRPATSSAPASPQPAAVAPTAVEAQPTAIQTQPTASQTQPAASGAPVAPNTASPPNTQTTITQVVDNLGEVASTAQDTVTQLVTDAEQTLDDVKEALPPPPVTSDVVPPPVQSAVQTITTAVAPAVVPLLPPKGTPLEGRP